MPIIAFLILIAISFVWSVIVTCVGMWLFDLVAFPFLMDLDFWQVFVAFFLLGVGNMKFNND